MTPTESLKHEHKVISLVLGAAEREGRSVQATGRVHAEDIARLLDFFQNFADRCHHAKEERHLFALMHERATVGGLLAATVAEHQEGRRRLRAVAEALPQARQGEAAAVASVGENLLAYAALLRAHIDHEDNVLFPMAEKILSAEDERALAEAFEKVEAEEIGEGVHEKYHRLAHDLAKR